MNKNFNLKKFAKYSATFFGYFLLSKIDGAHSPVALALFTANLYVGLKPIPSLILFLIPFLLSGSASVFLTTAFAGLTLTVTFLIYRNYKKTPSFEIVGIMAVALSPYAILSTAYPLPIRLAILGCTVLSTFILTSGARVFLIKGLKFKLLTDEFCSASLLAILLGYCFINVFGEIAFLSVTLFIILVCSFFFKKSTPLLIAIICSLPVSLARNSLLPISIYATYGLAVCLCSEFSRLLTAISTVAVTLAFFFFTNYFSGFYYYSPFFTAFSSAIYLFIPEKSVKKYSTKLAVHRTDNLGRYSVNLSRNLLAGKLFEIASTFDEMSLSVEKIKQKIPDKTAVTIEITDNFFFSVCKNCPSKNRCRRKKFPSRDEVKKIIGLGLNKGSLNLVDLPKSFTEKCSFLDDVLVFANEQFSKYAFLCEQKSAVSKNRELLCKQTKGLGDALKELARSLSKQLDVNKTVERAILENLSSCGIFVKEIAFFTGEDQEELNLVIPFSELYNPSLIKAIEEKLGYKSVISHSQRISEELIAITVKRAPAFDAAFGIARKTKDDKKKSGDTHSILKLDEGSFMIALNDGMGSGEDAENASSTAISLVETFYKAGLKAESVLSVVNKILSFGSEDNFTAMDVGVIDLFSPKADFIKIGSPYSFIITDNTVKIIEGNSLPLGILDEINPTVCSIALSHGDVIIFVSDGITDAFESSSDLIEFLAEERALNPKTLADNILERAIFLNGGEAKDDMTVFCVRIFSRSA